MLDRLKEMGIGGLLLHVFQNYLTGRKHKVNIMALFILSLFISGEYEQNCG